MKHRNQALAALAKCVQDFGVQGAAKRLNVSRAAIQSTLLGTGRIGTMAMVEERARERLVSASSGGGPRAA